MPLSLRHVPASQGARWLRDGFRLFNKHPLAFSLMFVVFWAAAVLVSALIPVVGDGLAVCALPLLGLGFMVASESALKQGPIHPGQFITALRGDAGKRRSQLVLCVAFGAATAGAWWLAHLIDGGSFAQLNRLVAAGAPKEKIEAVVQASGFHEGLVVRLALLALISMVFWHAPALVHWGGQRPAQALFSSALALWRSKGAFAMCVLAWMAMLLIFSVVVGTLFALLGAQKLAMVMAMPAALIFSTIFYVSLIFNFNDTFGGTTVSSASP